jgi:LDH2 family malate/lactate/ureidoglycolate dehydrogenase
VSGGSDGASVSEPGAFHDEPHSGPDGRGPDGRGPDGLEPDGLGPAPRFDYAGLRGFAAAALEAVGCPGPEADRVAECLVEADARGLASHGLLRLPLYAAAVEAGGIVPGATMSWVHGRGATATLDAAFGFGHTAIEQAIGRAATLAGGHGCAVVGVRRSTHFGIAAPWVERLAQRGFVAMVLSNTGPSMAPYGCREPLLGTNPIAIGVPVDGRMPIVLDMATSAGAYGRVVSAAASGTPIPEGWALDSLGRPTTSAPAALEGVLLPFGAHKGSGLAIMVELLAAALPGALLSHQITDIWADPASRMGTGHVVIAIDPAAVAGPEVFASRASRLVSRIATARPAVGHPTVRLPGDLERERSATSHVDGVALATATVDELHTVARRLSIAVPAPLSAAKPVYPKE